MIFFFKEYLFRQKLLSKRADSLKKDLLYFKIIMNLLLLRPFRNEKQNRCAPIQTFMMQSD